MFKKDFKEIDFWGRFMTKSTFQTTFKKNKKFFQKLVYLWLTDWPCIITFFGYIKWIQNEISKNHIWTQFNISYTHSSDILQAIIKWLAHQSLAHQIISSSVISCILFHNYKNRFPLFTHANTSPSQSAPILSPPSSQY